MEQKTSIDVAVKPCSALKASEMAELRKLWVHGVQMDTNAVGWLPTSVFDGRVASNEVSTVYREGDLVGWCLRGESLARRALKIYQIWVRPDARVIEHGKALISDLEQYCGRRQLDFLEAWVADDLEANIFWRAIGFVADVWRWGRGASLRKIYRYTKMAGERAKVFSPQWPFLEVDNYVTAERRHTLYGGVV